MRIKFVTGLLLGGFLLFVSCKSSLYDLCPNGFVSETVKTESHLPSCHKPADTTKSSETEECECPLAFQDYTIDSETIGKIQSPHLVTYHVFFETDTALLDFRFPSHTKPNDRKSILSHANAQFVKTIRLLI